MNEKEIRARDAKILALEEELRDLKEKCARIAEDWRPPAPPEFSNLRLQAEAEQMDAKLRPVQLAVGKAIAQAIRES